MDAYSFAIDTLAGTGSSSNQKCSSCDGTQACSWCMNCNEALCLPCVAAHRRVTVTRTHQILDQPPAGAVVTLPTKFCRLHPCEPLKLYCSTCKELTCRDCQLSSHRSHRYLFIIEAIVGLKLKMEELIQPVGAYGDTISQSLKDMETRLQDISHSLGQLAMELGNSYNILTQQIMTRMQELLKEAKRVADSEREQIMQKMIKMKQAQRDQKSVCEAAEAARNTNELPELLKLFTQVQGKVQSLSNQDLSPPQRMSQMKVISQRHVLESMLKFGSLDVSWIPFLVEPYSGQNPKQTSDPQSGSSQLTPSTSSPPTAPWPLISSVSTSVPALMAPSQTSVTTSTNQVQVVNQNSYPGLVSTSAVLQSVSKISSQLSPSTSCPQAAPLPLLSSVPALMAPSKTTRTQSTNEGQVVNQNIYAGPVGTSAALQPVSQTSSKHSNSTSCPQTAPPSLISSVSAPVPALLAPSQTSRTQRTNQGQVVNQNVYPGPVGTPVVLQPASQSISVVTLVQQDQQPGPPQNQPAFLDMTQNQTMYQVPGLPVPLLLNQIVPPSAPKPPRPTSRKPQHQFRIKSISTLTTTGNRTTAGPAQFPRFRLAPVYQPLLVSQQIPRQKPDQKRPDQRQQDQGQPDQGQQNQRSTVRIPQDLGQQDQRPQVQRPQDQEQPDQGQQNQRSQVQCPQDLGLGLAHTPVDFSLANQRSADQRPRPEHRLVENHPSLSPQEQPDQKPKPIHIQTQDHQTYVDSGSTVPQEQDPQEQDLLSADLSSHDKDLIRLHPILSNELLNGPKPDHQPSTKTQPSGHSGPAPEPPCPPPATRHTKGPRGLKPSPSQRLISDFLPPSSAKPQQPSPVVRAVADSACDSSVQQVALRQHEPSENEPTSTVSEEPEPEVDLAPIESESDDEEPEPLDSKLNQCQPIVSLYRLPLGPTHQGGHMTGFRLIQGEAEDEIYVEEMSEDSEDEDPVDQLSHSQDEDPVDQLSHPQDEDPVDQLSPQEPLLTLQPVSCSACGSANGSTICSGCGRGFHRDCHIPPVGCDVWVNWICSLCQDLSDPTDPYGFNRPPRPQGPCLSVLEQRRCERLLLYLKVEGCSRLSKISSVWSHLKTMSERLSLHRPPGYQTSAEVLYDIWRLFKDAAQEDATIKHLQECFQDKVKETFASPQPADTHTQSVAPPAGQEGECVKSEDDEVMEVKDEDGDEVMEVVEVKDVEQVKQQEQQEEEEEGEGSKLSTLRKRLRDFIDLSAAKRKKVEHVTPPSLPSHDQDPCPS
ncbi:uncharacterized protein trim33l isoform X2 [Halichoeres trimaculatus]|uniref:uncharacterized protein trim33l isoform X2 n=1 Tax=Halichoeres trimaculatus TaxID=147232 RepID=UPI003D9DDD2A